MRFEWHDAKEAANRRKHGVPFGEAMTVFGDPRALTRLNVSHSAAEDREVTIGMSERSRVLVVVHAVRENAVRIISARRATRREQSEYEEGYEKDPIRN